MPEEAYPKIGHFPTVADLQAHLSTLNLDLPLDSRVLSASEGSPLAAPLDIDGFRIGNRWVAHPMEGWDCTTGGQPTEHTLRRWQHFGQSGCKWIWGGEAFAVHSDARANPNQLALVDNNQDQAARGLTSLLEALKTSHQQSFAKIDDLFIGLQLTHSGRFCKPADKLKFQPRIAYHHPLLDKKFHISPDDSSVLLTDSDLEHIIDNYITAAQLAHRVGFHFVDVKHCHGYLAHELLSAHTRPGKFGGSLENRSRFARQIIQGIQASCPGLKIGVRLSIFDAPPFKPDSARATPGKLGPGIPDSFPTPYHYGFGCNPNNPLEIDLTEPIQFIQMLNSLGVKMINASCASPYYNPHFVRPAP
ncbi:MAG TPA: hypothetical protein VFE58_06445, partial [Tepidisphaeraceae bacterium]|nr:hypothetical protein [Tepidisphaeraceae bacterium]